MAFTEEIARLVTTLTANADPFVRGMKQSVEAAKTAAREVSGYTTQVEGMSRSLQGFAGSAVSSLTQVIGITSALGVAFKSVGLAAEMEKTETAFGTMLRSSALGKNLVRELQQFAAATPLELTDLTQAAKTLLQFGVPAGELLETMRTLGDTVGGDASRFRSLALAFGQMSAAGRLMGGDLLQMINAGFNPLQEISRKTGKSMGQLRQEMEHGGVTAQMVKDAFKTATGAGGQFENQMEKQSKTISGLFSTMKDDIAAALRVIGEEIVERFHLKEVMQGVSAAAKGLKGVLDSIPGPVKDIVAAYLAWAAATRAVAAAHGLLAAAGLLSAGRAGGAIAGGAAAGGVMPPIASLGGQLALGGSAAAAITGGAIASKSAAAAPLAAAVGIPLAVAGAATMLGGGLFGREARRLSGFNESEDTNTRQARFLANIQYNRAFRTAQEARGMDRAGGQAMLKPALESAKKDQENLARQVERSQKAVDKYNNSLSYSILGWFTGRSELKAAQGEFERFSAASEAAGKSVGILESAMKALEDPPELKAAKESIDALNNSLQDEIAYWGMSKEEMLMAKAAAAGLSEEKLRNTESLIQARDALKEEDDMMKERSRTFAEAAENEEAYFKDVEKFKESIKSPEEKFGERKAEIEEMLALGDITNEQATRGIALEEAKLDRATRQKEVKERIVDMDRSGIQVGSAEALSRIAEQRSGFMREAEFPTRSRRAGLPSLEQGIRRFAARSGIGEEGSMVIPGEKTKEQIEILKRIEENLKEQLKKKDITFEAAGIT